MTVCLRYSVRPVTVGINLFGGLKVGVKGGNREMQEVRGERKHGGWCEWEGYTFQIKVDCWC